MVNIVDASIWLTLYDSVILLREKSVLSEGEKGKLQLTNTSEVRSGTCNGNDERAIPSNRPSLVALPQGLEDHPRA